MVTAQAAFTTAIVSVPYLSLSEYKHAPTAIDVSNLVDGGSQADQDQELANVILRASSWIDTFCQQILAATVDVEMRRVRANRDGFLTITPSMWPVLEVRDVQIGQTPNTLAQLSDLSGVWIDPQLITIAQPLPAYSSAGPLQFGPPAGYGSGRLFCRYAYVNGWPTTKLAANALANATSIVVADATGIYGGPASPSSASATPPATRLTIFDGANTETISVASVAGTTLTLNAPLAHAHSVPTVPDFLPVSALPAAVREAAILLTSTLIKERGDEAFVLEATGADKQEKPGSGYDEDMGIAAEMLAPFRREF